jgi:hypothetical protein
MKSKVLALLLFGLLAPGVCAAQSLKSGTWTGTVSPPDGGEEAVTFDVTVNGDSLDIVIHAGMHGDFTVQEGRYAEGKISFKFMPGPEVSCTLTRNEEGVFAGSCFEDNGSEGKMTEAKMTMVPPKD